MPDEVTPELVDDLLALETREQQTGSLRKTGLLDADGLDRLLDMADRMTRKDPGRARQLAELCADAAEEADAPAALPRSAYIRVRAYNETGEFEEALRMVRLARGGYHDHGIHAYLSILQAPSTLEEAIEDAGELVADCAEQATRLVMLGRVGEAGEKDAVG